MTTDSQTAILIKILADQGINAENGEHMADFTARNSDSSDFANIARWQIESLMRAAFEAGQSAADAEARRFRRRAA